MNKKIILLLIATIGFANIGAKTKDDVLMKINNHPVTKSEFEYLYKKNNTAAQQQSLDEYLNLFVDYKLKVEEATSQGLDTLKTFLTEYNNYKNQLTQPYLTDTVSDLVVAKKIYDRLGENFEVSHILISLPGKNRLLPKDTIEAYNKALALHKQLLGKNDKDFELAVLTNSDDKGANQAERPGYLGWATSLMFVAPFENGMYATKANSLSTPVRSSFGYHLIKVHNRRPDPGRFNVSHIMFGFPQRQPTEQELDSVKKLANEVYAKLETGGDYAALCKQYSTDRQSAEKAGTLGWVQTGTRYPQPFMDAVFTLREAGEYTLPVQTPFGFHIIKLNEKEPRESWEEAKPRIIQQLAASDLSEELTALKIANLAKEINYKTDHKAYDSLLKLADTYFPLDSASISITSQDKRTLLTVEKQKFSVADFTDFLQKSGNFRYNISTDFLAKSYEIFVLAKLKEAYIATLGNKYPEYRNLLNEYHDGILLFNVMNAEVWEKAANDTVALESYFAANKTKYAWDKPRYKGLIVNCKDEETLKAAKDIIARNKEALDLGAILGKTLNNDSISRVSIRKGIWAEGENKFIDAAVFQSDVKPDSVANYPLYFVEGKLLNAPEEYTDAKGLVISDYQEVREKEWMQSLRDKYKVEIDRKALKAIK